MNELRIGVIGAGGRGDLAANAHQPETGVRLVAGADTRPEILAKFKARYGPDTFVTSGVLCSYQQCHYAPDGWRNYTIIGTAGRIENFGDVPGECVVRLWNRKKYYNPYGDEQFDIPAVSGGHGGADPNIVAEFVRYVRTGAKVTTSPIAARYSVAAGCLAAHSMRNGGIPMDIPRLPDDLTASFTADVAGSASRPFD